MLVRDQAPAEQFAACMVPSPTGFYTLSLHDALPILSGPRRAPTGAQRPSRPAPGARCATAATAGSRGRRSEEHTSELQSHSDLVCRLLLEKKNRIKQTISTYNYVTTTIATYISATAY